MRLNILVMTLKGGGSKTTISSIIASYLNNSTLIEVDKINKSDERINLRDYYKSIQLDWNNDTNKSFTEFEDLLLEDGIKIIDVGAVKLEVFHKTMSESENYDLIDLLIVPSMDGNDDFEVGFKMLLNVKDFIDMDKVLIAFSRFNENSYTVEEQFDSWFENEKLLKDDFNIDLCENYFVINDSYAIKKARKVGETVRFFADQDPTAVRKFAQDTSITKAERKKRNAIRTVVQKANAIYNVSFVPMLQLIDQKIKSLKKG